MARLATPAALARLMSNTALLKTAVKKALGKRGILTSTMSFEDATSVGAFVPCVVVIAYPNTGDTQRKVVVMNEDYTAEMLDCDSKYIAAWASLILKPISDRDTKEIWSKELLKKFSENLLIGGILKKGDSNE